MINHQMGVVEKKVLGALLLLANDEDNIARATFGEIAEKMGYKTYGGSISFALKLLEINNYISKLDRGVYQVLI